MAFKIFITERAQLNIEDAIDYYEFKREGLGFEFYADLMSNLNYIIENPFMFPIKVRPFREYPLSTFPFVIIYDVVDHTVIITSVFNTHLNPTKKPNK
jgi:hypothetical protein